nr:hypothetical protein CFP56_39618 [Quercus suber]
MQDESVERVSQCHREQAHKPVQPKAPVQLEAPIEPEAPTEHKAPIQEAEEVVAESKPLKLNLIKEKTW